MATDTAAIIGIDAWKQWPASSRRPQLVDVRSATEFASGHLPGAINIPLEQIEMRVTDLDDNGPVALVCQGGTRARMAAELLSASGRDLMVLDGGTKAWIDAGNPVVRTVAARWALERQVRFIAGLLVASGALLGAFESSWWLAVPVCVGGGLTFAGFTGLCPMGELLARMPWNRQRIAATGDSTPGASCCCQLPGKH